MRLIHKKIKSINLNKNEDVYDIATEKNHNFFANKILVHNCSELPLSEYSSCILMLINLLGFVDDPFTDKAKLNMEKFEKYVRLSTRLIDDMVDLELEKIQNIIKRIKKDDIPEDLKTVDLDLWKRINDRCKESRRVGLGITALGDLMASLGIKYDSEEALKFVEMLFSKFHELNMDENAELSKERGSFSVWDWEKEKNCHYITILPKHIQDKIKKHGRRNISTTTIAPAGSISLLTQTSSGIEPIFMRKYVRNRKLSTEEIEKNVKESYVDEDGIKWLSYDVYHHGLKKWLELNEGKTEEQSPYWGVEAGELQWRFRVKLQGLIQKYITHSISSTQNLPKTVTKEEVSEIYKTAWKEGIKGLTIYRDGSRQGVLVARTQEKEDVIKINHAPKRKHTLPCEIHYSNIKNSEGGTDQWIIFVGFDHGVPYEIFGGKKSNIEIPKKYKTGWVVKNGKNQQGIRTYDLYLGTLEESDERMMIKDIVSVFSSDTSSYTRIISTMLRHGVPIKIICEQLLKNSDSHLYTFEKAISRVLKKNIGDGEKAAGSCEKCGGDMQYNGGCSICLKCGNSKCF